MSDFYNCSPCDDCNYEDCYGCSKCQSTENELHQAGEFVQSIWDKLSQPGPLDLQDMFWRLNEVAAYINWDIRDVPSNIEEFKEIA